MKTKGTVIDGVEAFGNRRFRAEFERLKISLLRPDIGQAWPEWELAFDEAIENEHQLGPEKALEILKSRCPFKIEQGE